MDNSQLGTDLIIKIIINHMGSQESNMGSQESTPINPNHIQTTVFSDMGHLDCECINYQIPHTWSGQPTLYDTIFKDVIMITERHNNLFIKTYRTNHHIINNRHQYTYNNQIFDVTFKL